MDFGTTFYTEFSARAGETTANILTVGGYGGVKRAYAEGRITSTDSFSGVKAYAEGMFNTITLGGGERAVGAYAEGKGAGGIAAEAVKGAGETVLPINEIKTLADSEKNVWEKAEAVATGTSKVAGLLAGGLAARSAVARRLANKPGVVAEPAAAAETTMAPAEGVVPPPKPLPRAARSAAPPATPGKRVASADSELTRPTTRQLAVHRRIAERARLAQRGEPIAVPSGPRYPQATDLRTGQPIPLPTGRLTRVDPRFRVSWTLKDRGNYIAEWYRRGYADPAGGWSKYDIHHIKPREFGGGNAFENLTPVERTPTHQQFNEFWRSID